MDKRWVCCSNCNHVTEGPFERGKTLPCPICGQEIQVPLRAEVFISHASKQVARALDVCRALESQGISCWIAPRDLRVGYTYLDEIAVGLGQIRVMVLLVTRESCASIQVHQEMQGAVERKLWLIPVMLEPLTLEGSMRLVLQARQQLDATGTAWQVVLDKLCATIEPYLKELGPAPPWVPGTAPSARPEPPKGEDGPATTPEDENGEQARQPGDEAGGTTTEELQGGVDPRYPPYQGPRPFDPSHGDQFFGREEEAQKVLSAIHRNRLVLLYGPSGAGKSSLLNTVVRERLEASKIRVALGLRVVIPRVQDHAKSDLFKTIDIQNIYTFSVICGLEPDVSLETYSGYARLRLAEYLRGRERSATPVTQVLVFDQFEELFVKYPAYAGHRKAFFSELAEALEANPHLKIVLSMRQEFLAEIEPFMLALRDKFGTDRIERVRMERLSVEAALQAVTGPALLCDVRFAPGTAEEIVRRLSIIKARQFDGKWIEKAGEFVEPVQLQVVCERLWRSLPAGAREILPEHLERAGGEGRGFDEFVDTAMEVFYDSAVAQVLAEEEKLKEGAYTKQMIQLGCMKFVTGNGTRAMLQREAWKTGRLPNRVVEILEAQHLLCAEERGGEKWYELAHDSLTEPVMRHLDPDLQKILQAADLLSTWLTKVTGDSNQSLTGYFGVHPEVLKLCRPFCGRRELLFVDEAEFILRASLANGQDMQKWVECLRGCYPDALLRVLEEAAVFGKDVVPTPGKEDPHATVRTHVAQVLGAGLGVEMDGVLVQLALTDRDASVRDAAALSLAQRDDAGLYQALIHATHDPAQRKQAMDALCIIRREYQADETIEGFSGPFKKLDPALRRAIDAQVRDMRLRAGRSALFYVMMPAVVVSAVLAGGFKMFPAAFNWALCQASASLWMGLFHGAAAATVWSVCIGLAVTYYRIVFEEARQRASFANLAKTALAGAVGGFAGGWIMLCVVCGVFEMRSLYLGGWIVHATQRFNLEFWGDLLLRTRMGWFYPVTGLVLGVTVAMVTTAVRNDPAWLEFSSRFVPRKPEESEGADAAETGESAPGARNLAGLGDADTNKADRNLDNWPEVRQTVGELFRHTLKRSWVLLPALALAAAVMIPLLDLGPQALEWKKTLFGRTVTAGSDAISVAIGGIGVVVGMMFGELLMRVGIHLAPRTGRRL